MLILHASTTKPRWVSKLKLKGIKDELKKAVNRLKGSANPSEASVLTHPKTANNQIQTNSVGTAKPQILAYRLLGERTASLLPLFKDVDVNLQRSGVKISFKGYVSLALLTTLVASFSVLIVVPLISLLVFRLAPLMILLYTAGATLFAGAFSIIGFYLYPIVKADSAKRSLEEGLPFTTGYLSILAGAGVPPTQMFRSLANIDASLAICQEAKNIVRDVELFGVDAISALESASMRTPSEKFKELLEGFIATIHSGGDLNKYLSDRSSQYMRLKRIALRRLGDTLGVLAEFYVVLLVAGPLIMVVMLAVMAMLGGGMPGLLNPKLLLNLLTYVGIPVGSAIFLIMLDIVSPKR
jgi:flagellar protein FlaJ